MADRQWGNSSQAVADETLSGTLDANRPMDMTVLVLQIRAFGGGELIGGWVYLSSKGGRCFIKEEKSPDCSGWVCASGKSTLVKGLNELGSVPV